MNLSGLREHEGFRAEARAWLADNLPSEPRPADGPDVRRWDADWQRRQYDGGWAGISWPVEYGGRGLSFVEQTIWYEELVRAGAPTWTCFSVAVNHAGPTLIALADDAQKQQHLPGILRGELAWCQGFSEPSSGSDLASVRTRAVIEDGHLVVSGQKIWTSLAQFADYQELLVRTGEAGGRHRGLTWVICDMRYDGIDVRPIRTMDGRVDFCEVFYDDVRIPLDCVVGEVDDGWSVAMSTLAIERGPAFLDQRLAVIPFLDQVIDLADQQPGTDGASRAELAFLRAQAAALQAMAYVDASVLPGQAPAPESMMNRLLFSELVQRTARVGMDLLGTEAMEHGWLPDRWLSSFARTIAGGTSDIQRNVIGERVLGLPR